MLQGSEASELPKVVRRGYKTCCGACGPNVCCMQERVALVQNRVALVKDLDIFETPVTVATQQKISKLQISKLP